MDAYTAWHQTIIDANHVSEYIFNKLTYSTSLASDTIC